MEPAWIINPGSHFIRQSIDVRFFQRDFLRVHACTGPPEMSMICDILGSEISRIWDLSLERDEEDEAEFKANMKDQVNAPENLPPQLLFVHQVSAQPQIPSFFDIWFLSIRFQGQASVIHLTWDSNPSQFLLSFSVSSHSLNGLHQEGWENYNPELHMNFASALMSAWCASMAYSVSCEKNQQGQKDLKELHWHQQIPGMLVSTAADGFNVLMPTNLDSTLPSNGPWSCCIAGPSFSSSCCLSLIAVTFLLISNASAHAIVGNTWESFMCVEEILVLWTPSNTGMCI